LKPVSFVKFHFHILNGYFYTDGVRSNETGDRIMKTPLGDPSSSQPFGKLTADDFLNTFIEQAGRMAGGASCDTLQAFIQKVVFSSSSLLEESYRKQLGIRGRLTRDQYASLIVDLKNAIGGKFYVSEMNDGQICLHTDRCPFGNIVENAPGLCHMTSSIFGGIAARNFGYAKVELKQPKEAPGK